MQLYLLVTKPKAIQHRLPTTKLLSKAHKLVSKTAFNNCDLHAPQPKADRYRLNAFCLGISQNVLHMLISE